MSQIKKLFSVILVLALLLTSIFTFTSCNDENTTQSEQSVVQGEKGEKGEDGKTPYIGENGNWWIGNKDTGVPVTTEVHVSDDGSPFDFYLLPDDTYGIMAGKAKYMEEVVIPESYNGKSVTIILESAFHNSKNLKSITISNSIKTIDNNAFSSCPKLENITLGNSILTIGDSAFSSTLVKNIIIPDSVKTIGDSAFRGCPELTSITFGNNVETIGAYAFSDETSYIPSNDNMMKPIQIGNKLTSITIPNNVKTIGVSAFAGSSELATIILENGIECIENYAFSGTKVTNIIIPNSVKNIGYGIYPGYPDNPESGYTKDY